MYLYQARRIYRTVDPDKPWVSGYLKINRARTPPRCDCIVASWSFVLNRESTACDSPRRVGSVLHRLTAIRASRDCHARSLRLFCGDLASHVDPDPDPGGSVLHLELKRWGARPNLPRFPSSVLIDEPLEEAERGGVRRFRWVSRVQDGGYQAYMGVC